MNVFLFTRGTVTGYSVAYEESFVVIHVPCLTSTIVVMLLVNSNSEVRNCFGIVFIFVLKQS